MVTHRKSPLHILHTHNLKKMFLRQGTRVMWQDFGNRGGEWAVGEARAHRAQQCPMSEQHRSSCSSRVPLWPKRVGPMVQSCVRVVPADLQAVGSTHRIRQGRTARCGRNLSGAREKRDHGGVAEMKHSGLAAAPIPCSPSLI